MKALSVIHYPFYGGPANQILQLRAPLAELGWDNPVVLPLPTGDAARRLTADGCEVVEIRLGRLRAVRKPSVHINTAASLWPDIRRLRRAIRSTRADVVMIHGIVNPHSTIAARLEGVPVVWQVLDSRTPAPLINIMMPVVRRTAAVIMSTGAEVAIHHGLDPARTLSYFPPVDIERFGPDASARESARRELRAGEGPLVGMLANLNPQKGHRYFVEAASLVHKRRPDARFVILGGIFDTHREYAVEMRQAVSRLGLSAVMSFVDPGDRASLLLPALDLFVLSSERRSEGIPTAMLEAMSCGVPVVAAAVGSVPETLNGSAAGRLVPPERSDLLAAAILDEIELPDRLRIRSAAARATAVARFDRRRCAEVHVLAFQHALASSP